MAAGNQRKHLEFTSVINSGQFSIMNNDIHINTSRKTSTVQIVKNGRMKYFFKHT